MRFLSPLHPELVIADLGVQFVNGVTDVDAKLAAALRKLPAELGVVPEARSEQKPAGKTPGAGVGQDQA